jgi:hypothetical protein
MRNNKLCYYHKQTTGARPMPKAELPNLEDGNAIQLAIAHVARQVLQGSIEYRAAHLMADFYRLALRNLKNMNQSVVAKNDQVTVDPDFEDSPDISHITEPITLEQEQEMMEAGTLSARETLAQPAIGERVACAATREQSVRAESLADGALELNAFGKRETGNGRPFQGEYDFASLPEAEREAFIMRATGNKAYFMKEEDMPKRAPDIDDNLDLRALLRKELAG